jgi:lysophospholipase L1-like esterase
MYIVVICIIIIYLLYRYWVIIEPLTNKSEKNIILLGDSMLNNENYVNNMDTIASNIQKINRDYNIYNYAKDNATIKDIYKQLTNIDVSLNTYIFLSAGGNDILQSNFYMDSKYIDKLFEDYKKLITLIKKKYPNVKLTILNLYFPLNSRYKKYYNSIKMWNNTLEMNKKIGYKVLDTNKLMTSPKDFVYDIEPSEIGSQKIAEEIVKFL